MVALVVVLCLAKQSVGLRSTHPLRQAVDIVNENGGPYLALVMAYPKEEYVLLDSGLFVPSSNISSIQYTGRSFNIGTIHGVDVIYVMTGEQPVNAGVTIQILVDLFDIIGIVHYGIAGSTNDSLLVGDVGVPNYLAFTDSWKWMDWGSEDEEVDPKDLKFWEYNVPKGGGNLLGKVRFTPTQLFSDRDNEKAVFWMPVDSYWYNISTQIQGLNLTRCKNETECLPNDPKMVHNLKGATASTLLQNAAYRKFLYDEFNVSIADEESAAVVMTSLSNGIPCIVFRAISDMAGAPVGNHDTTTSSSSYNDNNNNEEKQQPGDWSSWKYVAAANALNVAVEFIDLLAADAGGYNVTTSNDKSIIGAKVSELLSMEEMII